MDSKEEYRRKLVTAEEAVRVVKPGDRVVMTLGDEPRALPAALAARKGELRNVEILVGLPRTDFGWFQEGWQDSFQVNIESFFAELGRTALDYKRADYSPNLFTLIPKTVTERGERPVDVFMVVVSPPDEHGFCSFGASLWNKRSYCRAAHYVLAEVDARQVRTYGDNYIHVSQIAYFVEHTPEQAWEAHIREAGPHVKPIMELVNSLVNDGDTIQIGTGGTTRPMVPMGLFADKNDLGWHSEVTPYGIHKLVKKGVITGKRKTMNQGLFVATNFGGGDEEDMKFVHLNPMFQLKDVEYTNNIRVISAHDNMVAINNAMAVDLTGQIASESVGSRMWSGAGGQTEFAMGALLSKGGRSITVIPATALDGYVSRIVATLEPGTIVTVPRSFADLVVTEYGVARLLGKSQRQRAEELIAIAHPDFRAELRKEAQKLL
ncbi:MAG: 4-hydroxybutyrate CoA-transferase [Chloroflexi bacterium]|nr:4-hydroxybutyrate CoA-transferase [Chloroflexota bacterium]